MSLSIVVQVDNEFVFRTIAGKSLLYHTLSNLPESDNVVVLTNDILENRVLSTIISVNTNLPIRVKVATSIDSAVSSCEQFIDPDDSLLIVSPSELFGLDYGLFLYSCEDSDGAIVTTIEDTEKGGMRVVLDGSGLVDRVAYADPLGVDMSRSTYYWRKASFFMDNMRKLVDRSHEVDFCHTFNKMILEGAKVRIFRVGRDLVLSDPKVMYAN